MYETNRNTEGKSPKEWESANIEIIHLGEYGIATDGTDEYVDVLNNSPTCLASGTKITMADGSFKNIEEIRKGDLVMAFNHEAGCLTESETIFIYESSTPKCAFTLYFSNGVSISIVGEHDLFEQENLKYVTISEENAEQFIGKHFYSVSDEAYVELINVVHETNVSDYYTIYTKNTINTVANGLLNVSDYVDPLLNIYKFNENLQTDMQTLNQDLQKYGLFSTTSKYAISEEEYCNWNFKYLNIAVGKGLTSWENIHEKLTMAYHQ